MELKLKRESLETAIEAIRYMQLRMKHLDTLKSYKNLLESAADDLEAYLLAQ